MQEAVQQQQEHYVGNSVSETTHHESKSLANGAEQAVQQTIEELHQEVLAMNTLAMQKSNEGILDDSRVILSSAYMKLHNYVSGGNQMLLDTLRSTTLNNLGVVECHRGQHRQALSHFEAARQLEETWGSVSPSVALNSCAAYNALGMYDKATAAAAETIDMLRTLSLQEKNDNMPTVSDAPGTGFSTQGSGITVAKSDNKALWGAAWHNMAVAQINTARYTKDPVEHANAAVLFQNAMRATRELLGRDHPMTKSVTETYRHVRNVLRSYGVFRQHHTMLTVPARPVDPRDEEDNIEQYLEQFGGTSRRRAMEKYHRDLTITFCGEATKGVKMTERLDPTPYPGAVDVVFRRKKGQAGPHVLSGMALSETLLKAGQLYGNPHPLLYSLPLNYGSAKPLPAKDDRKTWANSWMGVTPQNKDAVTVGKLRSKQRKELAQQNPVLSRKKENTHNFHNIPSRPLQAMPKQQQADLNYKHLYNQNQGGPMSYQQTHPNYAPTSPVYQHDVAASHKQAPPTPQGVSSTPQHNYLGNQNQGGPMSYQQTHPNYAPTSPVYQHDVAASHKQAPPTPQSASSAQHNHLGNQNQGGPMSYQQTQSGREKIVSDYPKTMSKSECKFTDSVDAVKDRGASRESSFLSRKAYKVSKDVSKPPAVTTGFLPPLQNISKKLGEVTQVGVEGATTPASGVGVSSFSVSHATAQTTGPIYEQVKYVLLAEPRKKKQPQKELKKSLSGSTQRRASVTNSTSVQPTACEISTDPEESKVHQLFDAMWVAGATTVDNSTTKTVGRPTYYVSAVVDISKDQALMPEEVLQMVVDSCSSSDDGVLPTGVYSGSTAV